MIINELITNSIKYAFPGDREGHIHIIIKKEDDLIITFFEDNGVGLPEHINIGVSDSLGMLIIDSFVRQLNATINIERDQGTRFIIKFKSLNNIFGGKYAQ